MDCTATRIPYRATGVFSRIALDYLDQADALRPFFAHPGNQAGIEAAIQSRQAFATNRVLLVEQLQLQYASVSVSEATQKNIQLLLEPSTFTITTAHQPNLFTGPLYFIYKIVHTVSLAAQCAREFPQYRFVPVYYMGSEDADLDELGHFYLTGDKHEWKTHQTGAVGRMKVDKELLAIIQKIEGQLLVQPFGAALIQLLKQCFTLGKTIQQATFELVNELMGEWGVVVLIPDNAALKRQMQQVFEAELLTQPSLGLVEQTAEALAAAGYKVQAHARAINLFYLEDGIRNRIEQDGEGFVIDGTSLRFTRPEMLLELEQHPERFSPNVILRGLFQETILPNIAFIGGGGETAYWLQLKSLFAHYKRPYPVLVLRNSFMLLEQKWKEKMEKLGFSPVDFFKPADAIINTLVQRETTQRLKLNGSLEETRRVYTQLKQQAGAVDASLVAHVESLETKTVYRLQELEKKMLRAEKRKFDVQQNQVQAIRKELFPGNGLQERTESFLQYYAKWGQPFIRAVYDASLGLEQEFVVLEIQ